MNRVLGLVKIRPNNTSVECTIPTEVVILLNLIVGEHVIFCQNADGDVILRKNGERLKL